MGETEKPPGVGERTPSTDLQHVRELTELLRHRQCHCSTSLMSFLGSVHGESVDIGWAGVLRRGLSPSLSRKGPSAGPAAELSAFPPCPAVVTKSLGLEWRPGPGSRYRVKRGGSEPQEVLAERGRGAGWLTGVLLMKSGPLFLVSGVSSCVSLTLLGKKSLPATAL